MLMTRKVVKLKAKIVIMKGEVVMTENTELYSAEQERGRCFFWWVVIIIMLLTKHWWFAFFIWIFTAPDHDGLSDEAPGKETEPDAAE